MVDQMKDTKLFSDRSSLINRTKAVAEKKKELQQKDLEDFSYEAVPATPVAETEMKGGKSDGLAVQKE